MAFKLSKKVNNAIYGYGAAVVIIGALMKITYFSPSWAPGIANTMLTIGLVIEALIFAYSAIDPSLQKEDYEWEKVYPELAWKVLNFRLTSAYKMVSKLEVRRFQVCW